MDERTPTDERRLVLTYQIRDAEQLSQRVENLIDRTPTGDTRNLLTDANIHLLAAKRKLEEAMP